MKKFLLSFLTLILAGAMVVALILPLASVQTKNKETGKDVSQYAQSITMMDFIQSIFANDEKKADGILERPKCLDEILEYSRILSKDFPFVRADFYEVEGKVYFAELTFTPNGNYLTKYKPDFHERLGKKLILPQSKIL